MAIALFLSHTYCASSQNFLKEAFIIVKRNPNLIKLQTCEKFTVVFLYCTLCYPNANNTTDFKIKPVKIFLCVLQKHFVKLGVLGLICNQYSLCEFTSLLHCGPGIYFVQSDIFVVNNKEDYVCYIIF